MLRNDYKIKYLLSLAFCPKISLDFRYNALRSFHEVRYIKASVLL